MTRKNASSRRRSQRRNRRVADTRFRSSRLAAQRAEERGRAVAATPQAFERVAQISHARVAEALIARHSQRMLNVPMMPDWLIHDVLSPLTPMLALDKATRLLVPQMDVFPSAAGGTWPEQIRWGVDSAVAASRLLLCGQTVGAAVIARNQLERWTSNRAFLAGVTRSQGEDPADYIARVWSAPVDLHAVPDAPALIAAFDADERLIVRDPDIDHAHFTFSQGREVCPALMWIYLSEVIHGRMFVGAAAWDSGDYLQPSRITEDVPPAFAIVTDSLQLALTHLRRVAAAIHLEFGNDRLASVLNDIGDGFSEPEGDQDDEPARLPVLARDSGLSSPPLHALMPLLPFEGLSPRVAAMLDSWGDKYEGVLRGERPDGRLYRDDEVVTLGFSWHRAASVRAAMLALAQEKKALGDGFDIRGLSGRASRWVIVTEALGLCGLWSDTPVTRAAAHTAASALRSAWWLWLEDDDRAMAAARTVLEQISRLRTWRLKPGKADKLEGVLTPPQRWLEAAGWRRLGPLNLALGEFAHMVERSDWGRGRAILTEIQVDADAVLAPFTARGDALLLIEELAAREAAARLAVTAPESSHALTEVLEEHGLDIVAELPLERRLNEIWAVAQASRTAWSPSKAPDDRESQQSPLA